MRARVLLDVDGVLNALGPQGRGWHRFETGWAEALGRQWPVRWSPQLVDRVLGWRERADVEWLTTWGDEANRGLAPVLGMPQLPVAGTADDPEGTASGTGGGPALADVTPAAPDELTGRWWKFDVVRRLVRAEPERRLVWLDDDLRAGDVLAWTRAHADCLLIAPDPREGLTPSDADLVEEFLGLLPG